MITMMLANRIEARKWKCLRATTLSTNRYEGEESTDSLDIKDQHADGQQSRDPSLIISDLSCVWRLEN